MKKEPALNQKEGLTIMDPKLKQRYFILWMTLVRAKDAIHMVREKELSKYDISPQQSGILSYIMSLDNNATPTDISRLSFRKVNTVTITLDRMEKKGLIIKSKDTKRRNVVRVSLTEKGKQIYYRTTDRQAICDIFSSLSEEQCRQLESCFNNILDTTASKLDLETVPRPQLT